MGTCTCRPPDVLHILPDGVHLPDGNPGDLAVDDQVWQDAPVCCSVCAFAIDTAFFRCRRCEAAICRPCLGADTLIVECDCYVAVGVTGVEQAARRAAAALAR